VSKGPERPATRTVKSLPNQQVQFAQMEPNMTRTTTLLCAAAGALALYTGPAGAAPLSTPLAIKSVGMQSVESVRYHRRHHGRAYYGSTYNSFAFAPGYAGRRYGGFRRGGHTCSREEADDTAYPSWWCSRIRNYQ
jgi:hypothetical protein